MRSLPDADIHIRTIDLRIRQERMNIARTTMAGVWVVVLALFAVCAASGLSNAERHYQQDQRV